MLTNTKETAEVASESEEEDAVVSMEAFTYWTVLSSKGFTRELFVLHSMKI